MTSLGTPDDIHAGATRFQTYLDDLFDRPLDDPHDDTEEPPLPQTQLSLLDQPAA